MKAPLELRMLKAGVDQAVSRVSALGDDARRLQYEDEYRRLTEAVALLDRVSRSLRILEDTYGQPV